MLAALAVIPLSMASTAEAPGSWTREQMEEFLRQAKVVAKKELSVGVTNSSRISMAAGGAVHDAHWQTVDEYKPIHQTQQGTELNFRDSYRYNIAAYRLDKMLDLNMVPVSVERKFGGSAGAATWWAGRR